MDSLLGGFANFFNGYMGAVLVKGFPMLSMGSLLRGFSNFVNGYMAEALGKDVANFISGFLLKRGLKIRQQVQR